MTGNGFCGKHSTSGQDYFWEDEEAKIRQEYISNYNIDRLPPLE